jgi:hypothetical protein
LAPASATLLLLRATLSTALRFLHRFVVNELESLIFLGFFKVKDGSSRSRFAVLSCRRKKREREKRVINKPLLMVMRI